MSAMRAHQRKDDPSLVKIIIGILVVGGAGLAVIQFSQWFTSERGAGEAEASLETTLEQAARLLETENVAEASKLLAPLVARSTDPAVAPKALLLQARLDVKEGRPDAAVANLRKAYEAYPTSAEHPAIATAYGKLLEDSGKLDEARAVFAKMRDNVPPGINAPALCFFARDLERQDDKTGARDFYRQAAREAEWDSEGWREAAEGLGRLNVELIFSSDILPESKVYIVQPGDVLTDIGVKLNTTLGLLMRANGIEDPARLRVNQSLKYTPKDFRIVIERSTCRLFLFDNEGLFKVYPVGLGKRSSPTTLGRYRIGNKEKDPTWFKPGSAPIPPGDPRNELGTRWMPLVPEEAGLPTDLGIHGTIRPESIGQYESNGCPRLFKEDVEELYDLVVRSTPVVIVEKYVPEDDPLRAS